MSILLLSRKRDTKECFKGFIIVDIYYALNYYKGRYLINFSKRYPIELGVFLLTTLKYNCWKTNLYMA